MSPKSVSILYSDSKFERIRFYFAESDIDDLDDLALFNFDQLLFVPGVSEALVIEAKELFRSNQQHALKSDEAVVGEAYVRKRAK